MKKVNFKFILPFIISPLIFFFITENANAARVYFESVPGSIRVGDSFIANLFIDTEGASINAVEINIRFPKLLSVKNISKSGSAIQLWIQEPSFSGDTIQFTGGVPGGINSSRGVIGRITFEAKAIGEGNIALLSNSSVLLNDGQGTELKLQTSGGPYFEVVPRPEESLKEPVSKNDDPKQEDKKPEEKKEGKKDKTKPQKFQILFGNDPRVFSGEDFISFFSVDADSGIDRYEVKLGKESFKVARSPFLLEDIGPRMTIKVRAYDSAGNYRQAIYPGLLKRIWWGVLNIFL